jgi:hypothetical protein
MKRPTRLQRFFAQGWLEGLWLGGIPLLVAINAARTTEVGLTSLADWRVALWTVGVLGLGLLLGFFVAVLLGCVVLSPIYSARERENGGPFEVGDTVQILAGPHKGRVARVYSKWQGNSVRVELGAREKAEFSDIFAPTKLLKEEPGGQSLGHSEPTDSNREPDTCERS